ncbi:hypothetical protein J3459_007936 [Metarhizium acridum]|nr:hypothetical protein J3459_007936 [Metarhizium acridum]
MVQEFSAACRSSLGPLLPRHEPFWKLQPQADHRVHCLTLVSSKIIASFAVHAISGSPLSSISVAFYLPSRLASLETGSLFRPESASRKTVLVRSRWGRLTPR